MGRRACFAVDKAFCWCDMVKVAYVNFTGGEVSPSLSSRYDMAKYKTSCRHLENFTPDLHGPLRRRPGTRFLEDLGGPAFLLPFEFSADPTQNYVIVVQEGRIRVAHRYGFVRKEDGTPVELEAPYEARQFYDISYAQSGDIVYLAHRDHQLRKIERYGATDWRLSVVSVVPEIQKPAVITVNFSSGGNFSLRYKVSAVDDKGQMSSPAYGAQPNGKHPSDWVIGDYAVISWSAVEGAKSYNIYREDAGIYGLIGVSEVPSFRDDRYLADANNTPREHDDPFVEGNNPSIVSFHQQRLILAAPALQPQTWFASRTGSYEDFSKSKPLQDDDALEFTLASGRIDAIQWVAPFGDLLLGTSGGEYKAIGADQGVITPTSINVREQSYWGSARLQPLIIGSSILHAQRQGSRVRDLTYSLERDGYAGNDLSVLAPHLFDGYMIKQWDYQISPGSNVYAIRNDGVMLCLTYLKEHDIWGWSRVVTQGNFISVCSTAGEQEDTLYCVVSRQIQGETKYFLELFAERWRERNGIENAYFVDCGLSSVGQKDTMTFSGLDHLEGCFVDVLADGSPLPPQKVINGTITLPMPASVVHAGLSYMSAVCPQTPEAETQGGATLGSSRSYGKSILNISESVGGSYGPNLDSLYDLPFTPDNYGEAIQPVTASIEFTPDCGYDQTGKFWIVQNKPLPFTIEALTMNVDIQG